jgi:hypothetical protein
MPLQKPRHVEIELPVYGLDEFAPRTHPPPGTTFGKVDDAVAGSVFYGAFNVFPFDKFRSERVSSRPGVTVLLAVPDSAVETSGP